MLVCMLAGGISIYAQDDAYSGFSPYSVFGVGDLNRQGSAYSRSMGGTGIATRDYRFINTLNPAAVTARDSLSILADVSLLGENKYYRQGNINSAANLFNVGNISFSFPIYRTKVAAYVGITPYSSIGYEVVRLITDPSLIGNVGNIAYTLNGHGSIYQIFFGTGVKITNNLSAGAEFQYYFGHQSKQTVMVPEKTTFRSIYSGYELSLRGATAKLGAQYDQQIGASTTMTVGATYKFNTNIKGFVNDFRVATISSIADTLNFNVDTLSHNPGRVKLANEIGAGISFRGGDRWSIELDYIRTDASKCGYENVPGFMNTSSSAVFTATASNSIRLGGSYTPNRNDIRYYYRRVTYRAGAYYESSYFKVNGQGVNSFGLTFGASFPVNRQRNYLNVGMELGQRGTTDSNLIRERFVNLTVGINIFDVWFQRQKYN